MLQATENDHTGQECPTKKQAPNKPNSRSILTRGINCWKREIEAQKALIEDLKKKGKKRVHGHEMIVIAS